MIAITVSVFGARQTTSKLTAAKLSCAYVLGIAALFTPLGVVAALSAPEITAPRDGLTLGDPNAPVTIVEYGDYQCPFCASSNNESMS